MLHSGLLRCRGCLEKGENSLVIRVGSSRNSLPFSVPDGFDFEKDRYIPGIFDNVELILSGVPDIVSAQAAPDIYNKLVRVQVRLGHPGKSNSSKVTFIVKEANSDHLSGRVVEKVFFRLNPEEKPLLMWKFL